MDTLVRDCDLPCWRLPDGSRRDRTGDTLLSGQGPAISMARSCSCAVGTNRRSKERPSTGHRTITYLFLRTRAAAPAVDAAARFRFAVRGPVQSRVAGWISTAPHELIGRGTSRT